jgi:para-nitrobenzyl esterase
VQDVIVNTQYGPVRGRSAGGVARFFGIPYAAAPVGPLRFALPAPHAPWDEVREANEIGPNAPHAIKAFPGLDVEPLIGAGWRKGDDYLNLNIWAPEREAGAPLKPVMVWIHGGGFVIGSNYAKIQDGSGFAKSGIVNIAINYRMGIEGFLPVDGIPTNLGLRDMIFALSWVRENAASFGGDPDNVTVFGESAGAMAIANLIASPLAKGLFRRAIVESGHGDMVREIPIAQRLMRKLAKLLKVSPDVAGFRGTSIEDCLKAAEKVSLPTARINLRDVDGREPVFGISRFIPVYGDDVLPLHPIEALKQGAGADVELLIGTNAEEMNLYLVPTGIRDKIGSLLATFVLSRSLPKARKALKAYGLGEKGKKPGQALTDAMNDLVFRWPARRFAEEHRGRTHFYEFDWRSTAFGGELGASHGMEIAFVFDTLPCVTGPEGLAGEHPPQALADRVHGIWARFATDGALPWDEFDRKTRRVYSIDKGEAHFESPMPAAPFLP